MSVMESVAAERPTGTRAEAPFGELVRAEHRATWYGRYRGLWGAGAVLVEALIIGLYAPPINGLHVLQGALIAAMGMGWPVFFLLGLCLYWPLALVWTGTAALCADLLSIQYRENPEPHRQWHPREFLARAVGRQAPWLGWSVTWLCTWLVLEFWTSHTGRISVSRGMPTLALSPMSRWEAAAELGEIIALVVPAFAAVAALLSAASRRPRRGRLTLATWMVTLLLAVGNQVLAFQLSAPDYRFGVLYDEFLWAGETLAAAGAVWWIVARRYRRHPYTAGDDTDRNPARVPAVD